VVIGAHQVLLVFLAIVGIGAIVSLDWFLVQVTEGLV